MAYTTNINNHFYPQQVYGGALPYTVLPLQGNTIQTFVSVPLRQSYNQQVQPPLTVTSGTSDVPQSTVPQDQPEALEDGDQEDAENEGLLYQFEQPEQYQQYDQNQHNEFQQFQQMNQFNQNEQFDQLPELPETQGHTEIEMNQQMPQVQVQQNPSPLSILQTNYNDKESLKQRHQIISQLSLNPKDKKSANDDIRKSIQKLNRSIFLSFLTYLATYGGLTVKFKKPSKNSSKTFCLAYDEILDEDGNVLWSFEESINTINEYYKSTGKKRNNIRECAIVVEINVLLFLIEQLGGTVTYGKVKKMGFHLLLTTENVLAIEYLGVVYTQNEMNSIGEFYYENVIIPQLQN